MIKVLRPTFINPNGEFISNKFIDWLVQNKFLIMAYTVNTKTLKSKLKRMGITIFLLIITLFILTNLLSQKLLDNQSRRV